jgi:hypothetical protein
LIHKTHLINITPAYIICSRGYRSYLIFKLIINPLFEPKQAPFSSMNLIFIIIIIEMENAKKFLRKNPTESKAVAAKIFNVNERTLSTFIRRDSGEKNEEHNKILQDHEINALDDFIRSLLRHGILSTSQIVFSAIVDLKRAHRLKAPSKRWFRS